MVETDPETFHMVKTFENVRDFVKMAGKVFELLDGIAHLNETCREQIKIMRA